jgi:Bacterial Ig domain
MNERIIVAQAAPLQLASLTQPRSLKVTKPQGEQPIVLDLSDQSTKLDFSAIADEKMTLVQVGTKLVILFDNQSTVTADPFFDFSGRALSQVAVELGAGRTVNGEQFAQLFSITEDQSALRTAGNIPASGADFHNVSVDPLPDTSRPLALLGHEQRPNTAANVEHVSSIHSSAIHSIAAGTPTLTIPSPGGVTTQVFEGGLGPRNGEPPGTHAGQLSFPVTTKAGTISITSADGVQSVTLGGHALSGTPQTFTDATGSLTASFSFNAATGRGAINYTYTLLDNTLGIPSASFAVVVTDRDGDSNPPANLVINIVDDTPVARSDTDSVAAGQLTAETGNVLTGAGTASGAGGADVQGADGSLHVVGVAAGGGAGGANPATVGVPIVGVFGTLTLNADGSYSYLRTAGGGTDVFTYTISDADGSLAHTMLSIGVADSSPSSIVIPPVGPSTTVFEAGLGSRGSEPAGSHSGDVAFPITSTGTITFRLASATRR